MAICDFDSAQLPLEYFREVLTALAAGNELPLAVNSNDVVDLSVRPRIDEELRMNFMTHLRLLGCTHGTISRFLDITGGRVQQVLSKKYRQLRYVGRRGELCAWVMRYPNAFYEIQLDLFYPSREAFLEKFSTCPPPARHLYRPRSTSRARMLALDKPPVKEWDFIDDPCRRRRWLTYQCMEGENPNTLKYRIPLGSAQIVEDLHYQQQVLEPYAKSLRMPYIAKESCHYGLGGYQILDGNGKVLVESQRRMSVLFKKLAVELKKRDINPLDYVNQSYVLPFPY